MRRLRVLAKVLKKAAALESSLRVVGDSFKSLQESEQRSRPDGRELSSCSPTLKVMVENHLMGSWAHFSFSYLRVWVFRLLVLFCHSFVFLMNFYHWFGNRTWRCSGGVAHFSAFVVWIFQKNHGWIFLHSDFTMWFCLL